VHTVSVAVPVYNSELYLDDCIKSIINQTFSDLQILLIDDGSTDGSGRICDTYAAKDDRIVVCHEQNAGVSAARNAAIVRAAGKYICFVDADDEIEEHMIQVLYELAENVEADFAICGHKSIYINKNNRPSISHEPPEFTGSTREFLQIAEQFLNSESIQGPWGKLFRTSIINENKIQFPPGLSYGEDTLFVYQYISFCFQIISTSSCRYLYMKRNNDSLSESIREDKIQIFLRLYGELDKLLRKFDVSGKQQMIEERICTATVICIGELYGRHIRMTARERRRIIRQIVYEDKVIHAYKTCGDDNRQNRMIRHAIERNSVGSIDIWFGVKEFTRNNLGWLYKLL